jgi:ABC-type multidrug transport system ATPase subunit
VIAATDLRLVLDGRVILDGLSLAVARGEAVALVGPNGSGKTSVLRCLLGLVPFSGRAIVDGHDVVHAPVAARAAIGYVPQKAAFGDARAGEAIRLVARLRRVEPRVDAWLREVGLEVHAGERVRTFSGGMQQRLALAIALIGEPPVLLLDEPSASLDRAGQETFHQIVARLRRRGQTLLLASHRPEEVETLTDRVVQIEQGRATVPVAHTGRVIPLGGRR